MSTKTEFQHFISRVCNFIINDESFKKHWQSAPYTKYLSENLRRYSEYNAENKCIINRLDLMKENCRISKEADALMKEMNAKRWSSGLNKFIHREHLFPIGEAVRQMGRLSLDPSLEALEEILDKLELVLITKEQQRRLDAKLRSAGEPSERLEFLGVEMLGAKRI